MIPFEQGEICPELILELRALAGRGSDVPELVEHLLSRLKLSADKALFPTLAYFRAAFCLGLREVLPLREWLVGKDRSEVDAILLPAMKRAQAQWKNELLEKVS